MKLIVGLGNPGKQYKNNRHNVGFEVVERIAGEGEWKESKSGQLLYFWINKDIELIKPQAFMNQSGKSVYAVRKKHQNLETEDIYVVHDDLDIKLGEYKIQKGKGPKDHNGLLSIYEKLGTKDFWHVRIGVENRDKNISGEEYVLQRFKEEELETINKVIKQAIDDLLKRLKT